MTLKYFSGRVWWVGGVEKMMLKLTSASTKVGVESKAELGNNKTLPSRHTKQGNNFLCLIAINYITL